MPANVFRVSNCKPSIRRNASERINDGYFNGLPEGITKQEAERIEREHAAS